MTRVLFPLISYKATLVVLLSLQRARSLALSLSRVLTLSICSTLRCTNVSLLALRVVGCLITKIAARLGVFVVRLALCVC